MEEGAAGVMNRKWPMARGVAISTGNIGLESLGVKSRETFAYPSHIRYSAFFDSPQIM
jgi:hypothetical protein